MSKNISITENGAIGLATSGNALVDLNFSATSYRRDSNKFIKKFAAAYNENPVLAVKWMFYCRDVRGGMGERAIVHYALGWLQKKHPDVACKVMELLPEYGRWDDVVYLVHFSDTREKALEIIKNQLDHDIKIVDSNEKKGISLLGKWLPSVNASNNETRADAIVIAKSLGMDNKTYRQTCSKLRSAIGIIEHQAMNNEWSAIDYASVPSSANLKYTEAFKRHDGDRYAEFVAAARAGDVKMNASVLMPYEIVHKYTEGSHHVNGGEPDDALEAMWNNLADFECSGMVMLDGSGSMSSGIGNGSVTCHDVADSLAVYFAQKTKGPLHGKFLTFGRKPQFVDISKCDSLYDALSEVSKHTDCSNTDLWLAYKTLADVAVKNHLKQEDLPKRIIIVSDMEFDQGCCGKFEDREDNSLYRYWYGHGYKQADQTLMDEIKAYWHDAGYEMPKLVFWNVCSRTNTIPMTENKLGVTLMSGFSAACVKMAMSDQLTPFMVIYETLSNKRYDAVEKALMKV